jgi:hypothetical protein
MGEEDEVRDASAIDDHGSPEKHTDGGDKEAALARRMFLRAGLIAIPAALAVFTVSRPARAQPSCMPNFCRPGTGCNPDACGPQICKPAS